MWALVADPGVDDAVALAVLAGSGAVPDLVVSEPGNVSGAEAARNAAGLVALFGLTSRVVAHDVDGPAGRREPRHGDDGLGGLADRLPPAPTPERFDPAELPADMLVTGSLSAVAGAAVDRVVWMGGAIDGDAEFNARCAPAAADEVLRRAGSFHMVPLDLTSRIPVEVPHPLLADAMRATGRTLVHDAVAAVAWLRPELFDWQPRSLRCRPDGVLVAADRPPVEVAVDADVPAVRSTIREAVACVA